MKNFFILFFFLYVGTSSGQGIQFNTSFESWEAVLQEAQRQKKPIFVDVYTTWCGPCKQLDNKVFNQQKVGDYFNAQFLCVKIDAEKGYGLEFAKQYQITSFPSLLFFTSSGEIAFKSLGFKDVDPMLATGRQAKKNISDGITMQRVEAMMTKENMTDQELQAVLKNTKALGMPNAAIIERYLSLLPEDSLYTPKSLYMVTMGYNGRMTSDSKAFKILLHTYRENPVKSRNLQSPWITFRSRLEEYAEEAGAKRDKEWLNDILKMAAQVDTIPWIKEREQQYYTCIYYGYAMDSIQLKKVMYEFADQHIMSVDTAKLYQFDKMMFDKEFKKIQQDRVMKDDLKKYNNFLKFYRSNIDLSLEEIHSIVWWNYIRNFKVNDDEMLDFIKWWEQRLQLYKNNTIGINEFMLQTLQENLENMKKMSK